MTKTQTVVLQVPVEDERYPPEGWNWEMLTDTQGIKLLRVEKPAPLVIATLVEETDLEEYVAGGDVILTCPHKNCDGEAFYEVDESIRWNEMEHQGDGLFMVWQRDSDHQTVGWKCQACLGDVDLPDAPDLIEVTWS